MIPLPSLRGLIASEGSGAVMGGALRPGLALAVLVDGAAVGAQRVDELLEGGHGATWVDRVALAQLLLRGRLGEVPSRW